MLDVLPVIVGDGGAPGADGGEVGADFGIGFESVGFVSRECEARGGGEVVGAAIEYGCEGFGVGEGVVDAGKVAVSEVVGAAVEEVVVRAGGHQLEVAVGDFAELWLVWSEEGVGGVTAVAGAAAPPAPLVVAGAPTVVPGAVGEHELHVGAEGGDGLIEDEFVVGDEGILGEGGKRLFDVVAEVYGVAVFRGEAFEGVALAVEETVGREVVESGVGQLAGAIEVVLVAEDLAAEGEAKGGGDGVVDVAGFDADEAIEELCGAGETVRPALARGGVEECAVVVEGFGERDGVEDGDAFPRTKSDIVDPAAVGAAYLPLGPFVYEECCVEIFGVTCGVGYAQKGVDSVAAASMDECAGRAEKGSV